MTNSPWLELDADLDHMRLARRLRHAHSTALQTGVAPPIVRSMVSESWRRSVAAGVDPGSPAPRMFDARSTAQRLAAHEIAGVLPAVAELLHEDLVGSGYFAAFSDAEGVLLWTHGPARALRTAVAPRFLPGCLCSERTVGTNAIGTALVLDRPVQIFSAEHFSQLLHGWVCAAAPIHDPHTGEVLGAIDLSGEFRSGHAHSLALVAAVARAAEGWLAAARERNDRQLRQRYLEERGTRAHSFTGVLACSGRVVLADPPGWLGESVRVASDGDTWTQPDGSVLNVKPIDGGFVVWGLGTVRPAGRRPTATIAVLGRDRAELSLGSRRLRLSLRHSEIVTLLALSPYGMTVRELAAELYGSEGHASAVRAEMTRLRPLLGDLLRSRPYRLEGRVRIDVAPVLGPLVEGPLMQRDPGRPVCLLPSSSAPGVVAIRSRLARLQP